MASAVLASRNEQHWGDHEVYMSKNTSNPNDNSSLYRFNHNPNPSRHIRDSSAKSHIRQRKESLRTSPPPPPPRTYDESVYRNGVSLKCDYRTIDLSAYSSRELKLLKRRLISEIEQVRSLCKRIDDGDVESRQANHASSDDYGEGRKVQRPMPFELEPPVDFTRSDEKFATHINHEQRNSKIAPGKNKKVLGQKRGLPFFPGKGQKRAVMVDPQMDKLMSSMMKRCARILVKLMKHKHGWVFNTPVDTVSLGLHDYHLIIKHPMDLGTVKSRLDKNEYESPLDFSSDVRLTFNNAMTYNPKGQDVHLMAESLLLMFEQMFNLDYQKYEAERRRISSTKQVREEIGSPPTPAAVMQRALPEPNMIAEKSDSSPRVQSTLSDAPPVQISESPLSTSKAAVPQRSTVKLPKPKAKDPNKRPMSFEEKTKLGVCLQNLPPEKMDQLVQIIKKRNSHLAQEEDEIELDIEAIDTETLWELDRFVCYHKKAVSKMRRQGLYSNTISASQTQTDQSVVNPPNEPTSESAPKSKKGDAGEEDVDIGEEIPVASFPPVEIEKDFAHAGNRSSSSSSSSSGSDSSSSSDSGSGSSSGSDSEEDSVQSPFVEPKEAPMS